VELAVLVVLTCLSRFYSAALIHLSPIIEFTTFMPKHLTWREDLSPAGARAEQSGGGWRWSVLLATAAAAVTHVGPLPSAAWWVLVQDPAGCASLSHTWL